VVALISASLSFVVGLLAGAAIQRWGDADRATEHHTKPTVVQTTESEMARLGVLHRPTFYVRDWGRLQ
jgi:hypothetical protein